MVYSTSQRNLFAMLIIMAMSIVQAHELPYVLQQQDTDTEIILARKPQKKLTIMIYMAADNNLGKFAIKNLEQMMRVGSTDQVNIVVQLDIRLQGNKKITCRYYIERDNVEYLNAHEATTQKMDSGNPETLISFCTYAVHAFPADEYGLILWNHGTGIIDPGTSRIIDTTDLFVFNPTTHKLDIDRTVPFLDLLESMAAHEQGAFANTQQQRRNTLESTLEKLAFKEPLELLAEDNNRGICWDDTTGNYLSNQGLEFCLAHICSNVIHKKFAFVGFDACLMAMIEVYDIVQRYAHYAIGSQEIEYGAGWRYDELFSYFLNNPVDIKQFVQHAVTVYHKTYKPITEDYTLSALDLQQLGALTENVNLVAALLVKSLKIQAKDSIKNVIKACGSRGACTYFDEPTYVDLHHLYSNILASISLFEYRKTKEANTLKAQLTDALRTGRALIERMVIANTAGKNLSKAKGLSIYFPDRRIHPSYRKTVFVKQNAWLELLGHLLTA